VALVRRGAGSSTAINSEIPCLFNQSRMLFEPLTKLAIVLVVSVVVETVAWFDHSVH
jgi:hypothetical protein